MIGHLGSRVSALLDGQLPVAESERAWAHVHTCHSCRDLVEREGWVKTRLAGLTVDAERERCAPDHLKGSLLGSPGALAAPAFAMAALPDHDSRPRRPLGMVAIGGGAVGAAVVGVLALGVGPSDAPTDRRPPVTSIRQSDAPTPTPTLRRPTLP